MRLLKLFILFHIVLETLNNKTRVKWPILWKKGQFSIFINNIITIDLKTNKKILEETGKNNAMATYCNN